MAEQNSAPPRPMELDENEKYVRIEIDQKGKTTVEAFNFAGEGCRAATEKLEARLGTAGKRTEKDPEGGDSLQTIRV